MRTKKKEPDAVPFLWKRKWISVRWKSRFAFISHLAFALLAPVYEEMRTFLFVVVHLPLLGLRTRSLYSNTFKSRWIVRGVVPNSSTSSWVVTVPFSLMYIYTDLMRVSIRCVEGFKRPLPILASFAWHNRQLQMRDVFLCLLPLYTK